MAVTDDAAIGIGCMGAVIVSLFSFGLALVLHTGFLAAIGWAIVMFTVGWPVIGFASKRWF